ncbi:unnamed protein product [Caretta caretta]
MEREPSSIFSEHISFDTGLKPTGDKNNKKIQSKTGQEESSAKHLFGHFQPLFSSNLILFIIESRIKTVSD